MKIVKVKKHCPDKNCSGEMIATGLVFIDCQGRKHDHKCECCGMPMTYGKSYPYTYYKFEEHEMEETWDR